MSYQSDLRDEVYVRIGVKQAAVAFTFNDFQLIKTARPYNLLETLADETTFKGRCYVIAGTPGDISAATRNNAGLRTYSVIIGYQRVLGPRIEDLTFFDTLTTLVEQLEIMARKEIGDPANSIYSFSHLEYLKDENEIPYSFVMLRKALTFEAYITAFYNLVLP